MNHKCILPEMCGCGVRWGEVGGGGEAHTLTHTKVINLGWDILLNPFVNN